MKKNALGVVLCVRGYLLRHILFQVNLLYLLGHPSVYLRRYDSLQVYNQSQSSLR